MSSRRRVPRLALVSGALAIGTTLGALAQDLVPPATTAASAGVMDTRTLAERRTAMPLGPPLALRTGFVPDPVVFRGQLAPAWQLARLAPDCVGLSSQEPTQRVQMQTRFGFLRVFATGAADLTLAVRSGESVICSDDRFGHHPAIEGRFNPGELAIWVGVDGAVAPEARGFELEITETRSIRPGVRRGEESERLSLAIEAGLETQPETGSNGDLRLRRGFLPDPRFLSGTLTPDADPVDVSSVSSNCRGYVTARPSHVLTLQDDLDFFQIYVAEATENTTLIVVGPDEDVGCDASDGDHPNVTSELWPAGVYRIWVGAHRTDASFPYRLGFSEIRRVR